MARRLAQQLDRIARNHTSGAAMLAIDAVAAVESWLVRHPAPTESELEDVTSRLLRLQSSMAPMLRLANEVALAADATKHGPALARNLRAFRQCLERARGRIARHFSTGLRERRHWTVATISYSSTVIRAITSSRRRFSSVLIGESRPSCEGRFTAQKLAAAAVPVQFCTDAGLMSLLHSADLLVLGADTVLSYAFVNKIGTRMAFLGARESGIPVWVLSDSLKFLPEVIAAPFWRPSEGPAEQVWQRPPRGVGISNPYFEHTELTGVRVITEAGALGPAQVRQAVEAIRVSPRLKRLAE
jgi:translation initiation factor 2B subunit (eIF-2B alpha/beta/delta family)